MSTVRSKHSRHIYKTDINQLREVEMSSYDEPGIFYFVGGIGYQTNLLNGESYSIEELVQLYCDIYVWLKYSMVPNGTVDDNVNYIQAKGYGWWLKLNRPRDSIWAYGDRIKDVESIAAMQRLNHLISVI